MSHYFFAGFSNARAEALNSKIKDFRHRLRGVKSLTFFFYRIEKLLV
ncbi:MAG: transposase [Rikenellaceae bacterium]